MDKTSNAIDILKAYNQDHIINLLNKLEGDKKEELEEIGTKSIKNGEYAVVTMAGGQGTRLRTFRPKRHI